MFRGTRSPRSVPDRRYRDVADRAASALGDEHELTNKTRAGLAFALIAPARLKARVDADAAGLANDAREAVALLEACAPRATKFYGGNHPAATAVLQELQRAKQVRDGIGTLNDDVAEEVGSDSDG